MSSGERPAVARRTTRLSSSPPARLALHDANVFEGGGGSLALSFAEESAARLSEHRKQVRAPQGLAGQIAYFSRVTVMLLSPALTIYFFDKVTGIISSCFSLVGVYVTVCSPSCAPTTF